ncbi:MAG: FeoB-associated Cys-rich membrane protein [Clostridia bacterium]|nr:FeoB-associated Cys-rich membrane protein [Clostridia bacterium]
MVDIILGLFLLIILSAAIVYILKEKKKGTKCIGCPMSKTCSSAKKGGCRCNEK